MNRLACVRIVTIVPVLVSLAVGQDARAQARVDFATLTLAPDRLSASCRISRSESDATSARRPAVRRDPWAGLPIPTNPYVGPDRSVAVVVRERLLGAPEVPDGPPLSGAELRRFRARSADDVVESYVAFYSDSQGRQVGVYGVRGPAQSQSPRPARTLSAEAFRSAAGDALVVVVGDGQCLNLVLPHVTAVVRP